MPPTRRKLTTIFCADVQDYSRLMGKDEEGTLAALKRSRDAMARLIEAREGRVVNTWGDGVIAEFPSVVEAVRAAIDVQNELAGLNAERHGEARMDYRIGLNLGDVIADGDDLYGDGVNIAARLQASAPAGGIVISSTVYDQVRNKLAVGFEFLGALTVKNIDGGVPSYVVQIGTAEGTVSHKGAATGGDRCTFGPRDPGRRHRGRASDDRRTHSGRPSPFWRPRRSRSGGRCRKSAFLGGNVLGQMAPICAGLDRGAPLPMDVHAARPRARPARGSRICGPCGQSPFLGGEILGGMASAWNCGCGGNSVGHAPSRAVSTGSHRLSGGRDAV